MTAEVETIRDDDDAKLDAMLRRDWLILEAHGSLCGCSACSWKKILDDMTKEGAK